MCTTGKYRNYSQFCSASCNKSQNSQPGQGSARLGSSSLRRHRRPGRQWAEHKPQSCWQPHREQAHEPNQQSRKGIFPFPQHLLDIIYSFLHPSAESFEKRAQGSSVWTWGTSLQKAKTSKLCSARGELALRVQSCLQGAHQQEAILSQWAVREQVQIKTQGLQPGCKWKGCPERSHSLHLRKFSRSNGDQLK